MSCVAGLRLFTCSANAVETENSQSEVLATEDDQLSERVSEKDADAGKQEMQKESLNDAGSAASGWEEAVKESKGDVQVSKGVMLSLDPL